MFIYDWTTIICALCMFFDAVVDTLRQMIRICLIHSPHKIRSQIQLPSFLLFDKIKMQYSFRKNLRISIIC